MAAYAWALWLAVPVVATLLAAIWTWSRGRPPKPPSTRQRIAEHRGYLDALSRAADENRPQSPPGGRR